MNLQKLFEAQAELDAYIEQQHPTLPGENRLEKKVLALLVELGECANEWRGFKFWSNRQTANDLEWVDKECKSCKGTGIDVEGVASGNPYPCIECQGESFVAYPKNPLLEEYVDVLHFSLSIGNDVFGELSDENIKEILEDSRKTDEASSVITTFIILNSCATVLAEYEFEYVDYRDFMTILLNLGLLLGFAEEQIEEAYWKKYEINKQRQRDGY
ncbi:dUTPase family protein [Kurthia sp. 11kri321]|uniref:dUTP diphosphatase n=1 Tax=Kurthia sp. 11kri321 TaxID=1750719 RepID=UPI000745C17E|nr:dUTP diphosphatase [Kurthia sp. 11kri321]AMA62057.1 dUTPase family protein [Kurthia sp. 11kri321]